MIGRWLGRLLLVTATVICAGAPLDPTYAQRDRELDRLVDRIGSLHRAGKNAEATATAERALALAESRYGPDDLEVSTAAGNLGLMYWFEDRLAEAERLILRALKIDEAKLGPIHENIATALSNLGLVYTDQGRLAEAERMFRRAIEVDEKALGRNHKDVGPDLVNLAGLYQSQGRLADAEPLFQRALQIAQAAYGPRHAEVGSNMANLGALYRAQGRHGEAEPLLKQALKILEAARGQNHIHVNRPLTGLAELYREQGRFAESEALYIRRLKITEGAHGSEHGEVGTALGDLALLYLAQSDWARAADYWRRSANIIVRRTRQAAGSRGSGSAPGQAVTGNGRTEAQLASDRFAGLVKVLHRLVSEGRTDGAREVPESFRAAQWALSSEAASSLAQMAARGAVGDRALGPLVRQRQDLVGEWQALDRIWAAAVVEAPNRRDKKAEATTLARLEEIDRQVQAIDGRLKVEFPDYAALATPSPLALGEAAAALGPDEALVLFLVTPGMKPLAEETFVWAVTKSAAKWARIDLGPQALQREVAALRCGLDYEGSWAANAAACAELTQTRHSEADQSSGKPLPFDLVRSHALYTALFGQVADVIKGKHLLVVPTGALTQLPFQVLVSAPPSTTGGQADAMRKAAWLIRDHAVTVLPSVASLKSLRDHARASRASRPMIGFGNPLLDGAGPEDAERARMARANTSCPVKVASLSAIVRGKAQVAVGRSTADVDHIRALLPLPETADELCAVARSLKAGSDDIYLGARATVPEIQRLSDSGELQKYRLVHFATHGALAGQIGRSAEPGLILTPPRAATPADDGYLSASRVAGLKLDADWVILSACNTAAAGAASAEALSGLARAFLYAGARALLVSHWSVDSNATVKLITGAIGRISADPSLGRASALRASMLALIERGSDAEVHPAVWAPFVVVGEGAAAR